MERIDLPFIANPLGIGTVFPFYPSVLGPENGKYFSINHQFRHDHSFRYEYLLKIFGNSKILNKITGVEF